MLVPDASNKSFVDALRAFISRRGCPQVVISDNGGVFTGELTQLFAASHGITWKFNLSNAPWQGGFWERLISSVKRCIKKTIKRDTLTFSEIQTVLYEIENILNNRPLCVYDEEDLEEAISPNHILFGRKLRMVNFGNNVSCQNVENLPKRVKFINNVITEYWERWR